MRKVFFVFFSVFLFSVFGFLVYLWLTQPAVVYKKYVGTVVGFKTLAGMPTVTPAHEPTPVNTDFCLVIPEISVNAPILKNVDGSNKAEWIWKVKEGVAHFKHLELAEVTVNGSFPGEGGNVFLFGHSQIPGGDMSNYQGVFNDLEKLLPSDKVIVYYQGERFEYEVAEGKVVDRGDLQYLEHTSEEIVTLSTCWPLGLDVKRYIIRAKRL